MAGSGRLAPRRCRTRVAPAPGRGREPSRSANELLSVRLPACETHTMAKAQKKLGEILVEWGFVQPKEVEKALAHAKQKHLRLGEALLDLKLCTENHVYKALAQQHGMEYIDLDKSSVPPNAVNLIPDDLMR